jgi:tRNA threonylcarbamoyladenosine biosynthesis protein TsaE
MRAGREPPRWLTDSAGPQDTEALGARIAGALQPGEAVLVRGELGAGKTTLVRGAARALGVDGPVTSPTFSIGHRYRARAGRTVAHIDLYRVQDPAREDPGLLADYLDDDAFVFVEWPQDSGELPGGDELRVRANVQIEYADGDRRRIEVRWQT